MCRPKPWKLAASPRLREAVEAGLELGWSPQQVSRRLVLDHPDDATMWVSHESIYLAVFQPARRALRAGLHHQLRTGRSLRHPKLAAVPTGRGWIRNMVLIGDRPAEVEDRAQPWALGAEHLVMGTRPSAVATLVERTTRLVRLVALPAGIKSGPRP